MINRAGINDIEHIVARIYQRFGQVDNMSAQEIIKSMTKQDIIDTLGYTPMGTEVVVESTFDEDGVIETGGENEEGGE